MDMLMRTFGALQNRGLTGNDLATAWVSRRIQPLQARERPMWTYTGEDDPVRVNPGEVSQHKFEEKMRHLTMVRSNLRMEGPVPPFSAAGLPLELCSD